MSRSRPSPATASPPGAAGRGRPRPVSAGRRWTPLRVALVGATTIGLSLLITRGIVGWNEARARSLEVACKRAHEAGRYEEEERLARAWMKAAPGAAAPIFFLAEAQLGLGRSRDAAATFATLPDGDPLTIPGLSDRADILFGELSDPREGARTCERILAQDPANVEAHRRACFFSAITLDRRRLAEQARRAIDAGADLPETFVYLLGASWLTLSNTLAVNSHWLERAPDDETFLVAAARGFVSSSGLEDEVVSAESPETLVEPEHDRRMRELLERFPGNRELLAYFLQKASTRGDLPRVTDLLSQVPADAEGDNRFWRFKGWVHEQAGEVEEAEAAHRRALEIDPFDFLTRHQLAGVLRKAGRTDEAAEPARLAAEGRNLRKRILQAPDVRAIPPDILAEMASYARDCGAAGIAERLAQRIAQLDGQGTGRRAGGGGPPISRPPGVQFP